MSFTDAVRTSLSKYVVWQGRASRAEYWWFALFQLLVFIVAAVFDAAAGTPAFVVIAILALILPSLSVTIRRLHDTGRSGAWYWIGLVPLVGPIVLLVFMLMDSDRSANTYGLPPSREPVGVQA